MDAGSLKRWSLTAGLALLCCVGCAERKFSLDPGPLPDWMKPADEARGQAPDEPTAPIGPITIVNPLPDPLSDEKPAVRPITPPKLPNSGGLTPAAFSSTPSATDLLRDKQVKVAAYIGTETVITDDEVWQMVRQRGGDYGELFGKDKEKKEQEIYKEELRKLIERELLITEMTFRMKKNKAEDKIDGLRDFARDTASRRLKAYQEHRKIPSETEFAAILRMQGLTMKGIRRQLERDALAGVYLDQMLRDKVKFVTLNDLWDYYLANPSEFAMEEKIKWLDLFIGSQRFDTPEAAKQYADAVWRAAANGGDFVALVKQYSHGDSTLRNGEGVGTKRGEIDPPELEKPVFDVAVGEISPLLQTGTGYHIVKVVEKQPGGTRPFDATVQAAIRAKLTKQIQEKEGNRLLDDLWRRYRPRVIE